MDRGTERLRTELDTVWRTNDPVFNARSSFELTAEDWKSEIHVTVWDRGSGNEQTRLIGGTTFAVEEVMLRSKVLTGWFFLTPADVSIKDLSATDWKTPTSIQPQHFPRVSCTELENISTITTSSTIKNRYGKNLKQSSTNCKEVNSLICASRVTRNSELKRNFQLGDATDIECYEWPDRCSVKHFAKNNSEKIQNTCKTWNVSAMNQSAVSNRQQSKSNRSENKQQTKRITKSKCNVEESDTTKHCLNVVKYSTPTSTHKTNCQVFSSHISLQHSAEQRHLVNCEFANKREDTCNHKTTFSNCCECLLGESNCDKWLPEINQNTDIKKTGDQLDTSLNRKTITLLKSPCPGESTIRKPVTNCSNYLREKISQALRSLKPKTVLQKIIP